VARYRKVDVRIWNDAKFVALSERGKLVFLFLMTHPNMTMVGGMRATVPGLAGELHMTAEAFEQAFQEAFAKGMVKADQNACLIWLPNFLKYNKPESPNVVKSWPDALELLPECALKDELFERVKDYAQGFTEGFTKAFIEAFPKAFRKSMPNQEQEQEQEQEQKKDKAADAVPAAVWVTEFVDAWNRHCGGLPKVRDVTDGRRKKVKARVLQGISVERFVEAVERCATTPFTSGQNDRSWKATFDWLVENDTHIAAVLEGKYDPAKPAVKRDVPKAPTAEQFAARQVREMDEERESYSVWMGMSEEYRRTFPWTGRRFDDVKPQESVAVA
jgi:hypothetical protein